MGAGGGGDGDVHVQHGSTRRRDRPIGARDTRQLRLLSGWSRRVCFLCEGWQVATSNATATGKVSLYRACSFLQRKLRRTLNTATVKQHPPVAAVLQTTNACRLLLAGVTCTRSLQSATLLVRVVGGGRKPRSSYTPSPCKRNCCQNYQWK